MEYPQQMFLWRNIFFSYFSIKAYVVGTHYKNLSEVLLRNTHNKCLYGEMRKNYPKIITKHSSLSHLLHLKCKTCITCQLIILYYLLPAGLK